MKINLILTNDDIEELSSIITDCQAHLQDYDLDDTNCPYKYTNDYCDKWSDKLEKLQKQIVA